MTTKRKTVPETAVNAATEFDAATLANELSGSGWNCEARNGGLSVSIAGADGPRTVRVAIEIRGEGVGLEIVLLRLPNPPPNPVGAALRSVINRQMEDCVDCEVFADVRIGIHASGGETELRMSLNAPISDLDPHDSIRIAVERLCRAYERCGDELVALRHETIAEEFLRLREEPSPPPEIERGE